MIFILSKFIFLFYHFISDEMLPIIIQDELFDIRELRIPREFLFLSHPWLVSESEYAFIVPVLHDEVYLYIK